MNSVVVMLNKLLGLKLAERLRVDVVVKEVVVLIERHISGVVAVVGRSMGGFE